VELDVKADEVTVKLGDIFGRMKLDFIEPTPEQRSQRVLPAMTITFSASPEIEACAERWRALVAKTKVGGLLPITFEVETFSPLDISIKAYMRVPDRDGPYNSLEQPQIRCRRVVHGEPEASVLRALARELYLHELDEWFLVDGVRLYDPHRLDRFVNPAALLAMDGI
jgi:hypothetical protein